MRTDGLSALLQAYRMAPKAFQATSYWGSYEKGILAALGSVDMNWLRSGRYPVFSSFGFGDVEYFLSPSWPFWLKASLGLFHGQVVKNRAIFSYNVRKTDIQEMAFRHCELAGELSRARPITAIEMSSFGHPQDGFEVYGKKYSINFLNYYQRYCFVQKNMIFKGDEVIVELGSGAGTQVEVLKKLYPGLTIICLDLPAQIYLCEAYLTQVLGRDAVVGTEVTLAWQDLSKLEKGRVYCFGNWQLPMFKDFKYDLFWNAASFGEMEPEVVQNYLRYVQGNAHWIYLLQARHGKETEGRTHVEKQIAFEFYNELLSGYGLKQERDAWQAHKRLSASGGYFEAIWEMAT